MLTINPLIRVFVRKGDQVSLKFGTSKKTTNRIEHVSNLFNNRALNKD